MISLLNDLEGKLDLRINPFIFFLILKLVVFLKLNKNLNKSMRTFKKK